VLRLTLAEVVRGTQGALVGGRLDDIVTGVSIDSRTCRPGDVFFAIRGAHQDGHAFIGHARARGAACAVATRLPPGLGTGADFAVVLVDDTTAALQRLGAAHRRRFAIPVVAVTGSNGKTTTKELIATVLSARRRVLKPAASFNNQWGVPLTLLALGPEHEAAVMELGMNAFGEIAALAQICQPTIGVVTTIALAHLEGVGSIEGVQKAKGELVEAIPPDGLVVLNADEPLVMALAARARARIATYGQADQADVRLGDVAPTDGGLAFRLWAGNATADVRLPLAGRHNAWHAAAAAAVGLALGVALDEAAAALALAGPVKARLVWREAGGVRVLDDTYNANPASMRAALDTLRDAPGPGRRFAILGDMLELGAHSEAAHRELGGWAAALPLAGLVAVGPAMRVAAEAARTAGCPEVAVVSEPEAAVAHLAPHLTPGDRVLVKGSRGMRMERAVEALLLRLGGFQGPGVRC
jgi:UDP-N-acetylmuramoyl-tripeptide--D-alanyl-D-alanine ligase